MGRADNPGRGGHPGCMSGQEPPGPVPALPEPGPGPMGHCHPTPSTLAWSPLLHSVIARTLTQSVTCALW